MKPSDFTPEEKKTAVDIVCERISAGESLRAILHTGRPDNLPAMHHFLRWISEDNIFGKQYARAMETRADLIFDEMLEISDTQEIGIIEESGVTKDGAFTREKRYDAVEHRRLKVDTRKWILARMNPKKYGDRVMTEDVTQQPKQLVIVRQAEK
jgi:hypothetical protein